MDRHVANTDVRHDVINESYTLYGERRFVIEYPAPSNDNCSCYENSIIFIRPLFSGDDAGFVQ